MAARAMLFYNELELKFTRMSTLPVALQPRDTMMLQLAQPVNEAKFPWERRLCLSETTCIRYSSQVWTSF
jgi:hypothetical protein